MSEKKLVCHGAICKCQFGDVPDKLVVLSQQKNYINDSSGGNKLVASDKELGTPFQAKTFGLCKLQPMGSSFKPCMSAITAWNGYFDKLQLKLNQGYPLLEDSKATCAISGSPCIEITFHGQVAEPSSQNLNNVDEELMSQVLPMFNVKEIELPSPFEGIEMTIDEADNNSNECKRSDPPPSSASIIGTCQYYKWRFENFMQRHYAADCQHDPPDYYYGPMREISGGMGVIDAAVEWWTPSLAEEMEGEELKEYKRGHGTFKAVPSKSYGYKYCIIFSKTLMPTLSEQGKDWFALAKKFLQIYIEDGVVEKNYISQRNIAFNIKYQLASASKMEEFYTDVELRNDEFREFAFATHPDAYLNAGMTSLPISDLMKISITPDFKEWGSGATWQQAMIVIEEQIADRYQRAKDGVVEAQRAIENAVKEAEKYLDAINKALDIWGRINRELNKYRNMPWL